VLVGAGLVGPLIASGKRALIPAVVGEILAGLVIGASGLGIVDAHDAGVKLLSDIGFLVLMFGAGSHVPVHNKTLRRALPRGATAAALGLGAGLVGGVVMSRLLGDGHALLWGVLLSTGSAAVVLPFLREAGVKGERASTAMVWAIVADVATIVLLPLALQPAKAPRAAFGALLVAAGAVAVVLAARRAGGLGGIQTLRERSKQRFWALDLRLAMFAMFCAAWISVKLGSGLLIAGFSAGLVVATIGGPKRLSRQIAGVANGLFAPLFFVALGARLDVSALFGDERALALCGLLVGFNVVLHVVVVKTIQLPVTVGLIATAQLGVPAAAASLGLRTGALSAGEAGAVVAAALITLAVSSAGTALLAAQRRNERSAAHRSRVAAVKRTPVFAPSGD
jgi:Kef-type K+ transport system membrane component KefB